MATTLASYFVRAMMESPIAWNKSSVVTAKAIDKSYRYDKLEPDLGFFYFNNGSKADVNPLSHQAWEVK